MGVYSELRVIDPTLERPLLVPFAPDTDDPANMIDAALGRFGVEMPDTCTEEQATFLAYVRCFTDLTWPKENTLRDEDIPGFSDWVNDSNYSGGRKKQLIALMKTLERMNSDFVKVKAFVKQEYYFPEQKRARAICSPSDESKCVLGRIFKAIDHRTFGARYFVKGTNPRDWPCRLHEKLGEQRVTETDFTAFESHHRGVFSRAVYHWYLHMIRNLTNIRPIKDLVARLMLGRNVIEFKHIKVQVDERLMSGALWTSSANGVLNLFIMSYLASGTQGLTTPEDRAKWAHENFVGFVEGDDGLCKDYGIQQSDIDRLGLVLKMESHKNFTEAKFCGIICDLNEMKVIKDPIDAVAKMFVLPPKFQDCCDVRLKGLLRARALSYLCNFSHTPVLASACHWVLSRTTGYSIEPHLAVLGEHQAKWAVIAEKELKETRWKQQPIGESTRKIAEDRFGISVPEQIRIEECFNSCRIDKCSVDLSAYCTDLVFNHGERYLYHIGEEPKLRTQVLDSDVEHIMQNGLHPFKMMKSKACAAVNAKFDARTHPLEYCPLTTSCGA